MNLGRHLMILAAAIALLAGCAAASTSPTRPPSFTPEAGQADWWVNPADLPLAPGTRTIHGFLREQTCASGGSPEGRILGPWIEYRPDAIVVTYRVRVVGGRCPMNPAYPITISLAEDLGSRSLLDGGVDPPRDASRDPDIVHEPSVDCGPLVGTDDTKIACMAFESAALGDRLADFATFKVAGADKPCDGMVCIATAGIEARVWRIEATDLQGAGSAWSCRYHGSDAACTATATLPSYASPAASDGGAAIALHTASTYEAARASGRWDEAWALLSPYDQRQVGNIAGFSQEEAAYNAIGGSTYEILEPNRNPDFLSAAWLGDPYLDVSANADLARVWLVMIQHPGIRAVSAATTTLIVAPIGTDWFVWIGH